MAPDVPGAHQQCRACPCPCLNLSIKEKYVCGIITDAQVYQQGYRTTSKRANGEMLPSVNANFLLTSVAPDITRVCHTFRFLNPGAHLIFVLEKTIAAKEIASRGCRRVPYATRVLLMCSEDREPIPGRSRHSAHKETRRRLRKMHPNGVCVPSAAPVQLV